MSGRVLVVDDTATNRVILKAKLSAAYFTVILAENGAEALARAADCEPDIILLDVMMPDLDGFEVCRRLKAIESLQHVPVIMITALNSAEEKLKGLEAGADDFLTKPFSDLALLARVRSLVRTKMMFDELRLREATTRDLGFEGHFSDEELFAEGSGHVLFVADRQDRAEEWANAVRTRLDIRTSATSDPAYALDLATRDLPDAVVVGQFVNGTEDGRRVLSTFRARPDTRHSAVIFAVDSEDLGLAAQALELGATDYILAPFDLAELSARLRSQLKRKLLSDRLRSNLRDGLRLAMVDPLTGLFNRRYATRHLESFLTRSRLTGMPFATMILDLDRFKGVNDRYGHQAGDDVLREFARRLVCNVRAVDLVARLGGEEFFVAMPDVTAEVATAVAERIRRAVEMPDFVVLGGRERLRITVSIGVSLSQPQDNSATELIRRADEALYASKNSGRNRVTMTAAA